MKSALARTPRCKLYEKPPYNPFDSIRKGLVDVLASNGNFNGFSRYPQFADRQSPLFYYHRTANGFAAPDRDLVRRVR